MPDPVTIAVAGAGNRGARYARLAAAAGARIVAVAEKREFQRNTFVAEHDVAEAYDDWHALADRPRLADAVVIATQDADHVEPAVAFAGLGYHVLLEKPMATSEADCERIVAAAHHSGVMLAVCHVLRYTPYTKALEALLDSGRIGDLVTVEHLEPVGWWHQAHSYVRGNWRREDLSNSMLMAKSCHDIDWLAYIVGRRATRVSSFGGLYHFRPEHRPAGAGDRCIDCAVEPDCPYSAKRLYFDCLADENRHRWPLSVITDDLSEAGVLRALEVGPYGRCVYTCDNDVVDHQVVNLEYEGGVTASFTMTAFSPIGHRRTRLFGTHGYVEGDGVTLTVQDFRTGRWDTIDTTAGLDASASGGHGGGDGALITAFVEAVATGNTAPILSGPAESLDSHRVVWAAERSRRTGTTVSLTDLRV
jgi:predicted dehydrogenase